ncbi:u1 small nuclear ribonucleoprotein [Zalerion maritima]|uniref:U1 small nuclear ribonucleoprotein n=1 Tax=Zalerion maritima TaxID=339359 RepID=A0AAD5RT87_9PEZI|nr:u1 small nuclear ribonucleoprotein [Zalerion maritima]
MTDRLPPNLLALFAPRPPLRWVPPSDASPENRATAQVSGVADFLPALQAYKDADGFQPTESWLQRRERKKQETKEKIEQFLREGPKKYNPHEDPNIRGDAFKTLIVARLSYEANEQDLEREFGRFGPIERIRVIRDTHASEKGNQKIKPHRGYAFVVFEREKDMRAAHEQCQGIRIKDRRVQVDVERGRTVKGWKPRRLGGGLGGRGYTKATPARPMGPGGFGGGLRAGSFRGGFDRRGGGFRGGYGGDRGFRGNRDFGGGRQNGYGPPSNAPGGPGGRFGDRSGGGGGYDRGGGPSFDDNRSHGRGDRDHGHGHGRDRGDRGGGGGGGYNDRENPRRSGSNMEPIRPRGENGHGGGYRDRDYDRPRDDDSRKRHYDGGYEDSRKLRRY